MALCLRNPHTEQLAREVAEATGETLTQAITAALQERLARLRGRRRAKDARTVILEISNRCSRLPDLDRRSADEILGYNENGGLSHGS